MNHIELYEATMKNDDAGYELKALMRQFYSMEVEKANEAIALIKEMIDEKTTYYMTE